MPKIEEYNSQVEAAGPVGGLDPRVEAAASVGRAVSNLGDQVTQSEDMLYKRQEQADTSDIYAFMADKRSAYADKIQQGLQDGNLNVDTLKSQFQDEVNEYSQNIQTGGGQNYLQRQAARLQGTIVTKAAHGQAQLAGVQAGVNLQSGMSSDAQTLMKDPSQLDEIVFASQERTHAMVQAGSINPGKASQLDDQFEQEYAVAANRGFAAQNPELAKKQLDDGLYDGYISNPEIKKQMYEEIRRAGVVKDADDARAERAAEDARQAQAVAWKQNNAARIFGGSMSAKEVYNQKDLLSW